MITYDVKWVSGSKILTEHSNLPVSQVYVWVQEQPDMVIIVSKDGAHWQFPGGKPEPGESTIQTAIREVYEETGLDISRDQDKLQFFGYRIVTEKDEGRVTSVYLQLRYRLEIKESHDSLSTEQEDRHQPIDDAIKFVERVSITEACHRMSWLAESDEYRALRAE